MLSKERLERHLGAVRDEISDALPIGVHFDISVVFAGPGDVEAVWAAQLGEPNGRFGAIQERIALWLLKRSRT